MFVYLSKKIAIPNNFRLNCIAWNQKDGYIAVGGEDGLLKVLRVDSTGSKWTESSGKSRNVTGTGGSNLSMNQTLEGHNGHVQVITWNEQYQKLTSSDQNGVIIVWMLYKGFWYEEMINNRNKSVVKGMAWNFDGQKICIVYEDGAIIVGSVDGNRIWGKELKNVSLSGVQWSPDGKMLLLGVKQGEVHLYDNQGIFLTKLGIATLTDSPLIQTTITALHWYNGRNGYCSIDCPTLAICYKSGKVLLLRDTTDNLPIVINTGVTASWCCWNSYGSILAVIGIMPVHVNGDSTDTTNVIQFYTAFGEKLKTLKLPGREVTCCSWEKGSLRVAISIDSQIYFATVCLDYKWTYFSNTIVYSNERLTSKEGGSVCVSFWNISKNTCCLKYVRSIISVASHGEHCVLAVKNDPAHSEKYALLVCNTIATPVDTKFLELQPLFVAMTANTVVAASKSNFLVWNFRSPRNAIFQHGSRVRKDKIYHIDETPTGVTEVIQDLDKDSSFDSPIKIKATTDPICSICVTEKILLIGRESGMIQRYSLPHITLVNRYNTSYKLWKIAINCDSSRASLIDTSGILRMLSLDLGNNRKISDSVDDGNDWEKEINKFERKDVWAMCWAEDNPTLLAIMEKTRIYVFRGVEPEEPISCSGYICSFHDLEIRCISLNSLMEKPENPTEEYVIDLEVKSLRDTRELLAKVGLKEAQNFIQDNSHLRLWRLLAESALTQLELETAENAMVRCSDYLGIQFIKRLQSVQNDQLKRAEVAAFLGNYDEAESFYLNMDRRDLAISLRQKLGDYFRVIQLMKIGVGGSDKQMEHAFNKIGEHYAKRQNWQGAREYYEKSRNLEKLVECYYKLEDYPELAAMVHQLPDKSPLLKSIGRMLASVGLCSQAVAAYLKYGDVKLAVDTCVRLNHWDQAVELAKTYKMAQIGELLKKYASYLLTNEKILQAVELYKKANYNLDAGKLLLQLADEQAKVHANPLRLKKIHILAAILIDAHRSTGNSSVLLLKGDEGINITDNPWKGAEAYHFLLLAHRQIYSGDFVSAMKTALRVREYEDILPPEEIYSLLALTSAVNHAFAICSKAFVKLEALESISNSARETYRSLAVDIFTKHHPKDAPNYSKQECIHCETLVPDWSLVCPNCTTKFPPCLLSGKPIIDPTNAWLCSVCKHHVGAERDVVNTLNACPLCHSAITTTMASSITTSRN